MGAYFWKIIYFYTLGFLVGKTFENSQAAILYDY